MVAAAAYASTLPNLPVLDDGWAVVANPLVRSFDLAGIFREQTGFAGGETLAGPYRPVATLTNALSYALHAVHVEAVATLVARADLLAAAGGLGALLLALGWRERWWRLPAAAGLPAGPGLSRPEERRSLAILAGVTVTLGLALVPYVLMRPGAAVAPGVASWFFGRPPAVVALTMTRALAEYPRLLAWPLDLMTDFGYAARIPFTVRLRRALALDGRHAEARRLLEGLPAER
jgi:hypothetical protein